MSNQTSAHSHEEDNHDHDLTKDETYLKLFKGNREWVSEKLQLDKDYFKNLASKPQAPQYMLIGCSDSRVPPDQLTKTEPGQIFIHRNVANLVVNTDVNMLSVLQYAVEVLNVKHVIVMGHYGCGGVRASMEHTYQGIIDNWIRNIRDVQRLHKDRLDAITDFDEKFRLLVELNVIEQSLNLCKTSVVQKAWKKGINLQIHGWVYDLATGLIKDLEIEEKRWHEIRPIYKLKFPELR